MSNYDIHNLISNFVWGDMNIDEAIDILSRNYRGTDEERSAIVEIAHVNNHSLREFLVQNDPDIVDEWDMIAAGGVFEEALGEGDVDTARATLPLISEVALHQGINNFFAFDEGVHPDMLEFVLSIIPDDRLDNVLSMVRDNEDVAIRLIERGANPFVSIDDDLPYYFYRPDIIITYFPTLLRDHYPNVSADLYTVTDEMGGLLLPELRYLIGEMLYSIDVRTLDRQLQERLLVSRLRHNIMDDTFWDLINNRTKIRERTLDQLDVPDEVRQILEENDSIHYGSTRHRYSDSDSSAGAPGFNFLNRSGSSGSGSRRSGSDSSGSGGSGRFLQNLDFLRFNM